MTAPIKYDKGSKYLDPVRIAAALSRLGTLEPKRFAKLPRKQLDLYEGAALDIAFAAMEEFTRRKELPRGRAGLRLVAEKGELTEAGERVVRARRAARARWARR